MKSTRKAGASPSPTRTNEWGVIDIDFEADNFNVNEARSVFRNMSMKSSYCQQFGEPPKAAEDYTVMKEKPFRKLEISKFFKSEYAGYIEKWLTLK